VSTQNITDPSIGPIALDLMQTVSSVEALMEVKRIKAEFIEYRQVLAVDKDGNTAIHSGTNTNGVFAQAERKNKAAAGNMLASEGVPIEMLDAFEKASECEGSHLGDCLIAALRAGLAAGGEAGPVHSAGMQISDGRCNVGYPVVDLRIDWAEGCPIEAVATAWDEYKPQIGDYVQRALDPTVAPSYGVAGNL
jgi:uncharacterized Ntn-hydrolase superfamily protein